MNTPTRSYRIWFSQRSGSTLLCKTLEQTGIAGKPGELLVLMEEHEPNLQRKYQVDSYEALRQKVWELGSSDNGIFGVKDPFHHDYYYKNFQELCDLRGLSPSDDHEAIWSDLFPNCQHIYLTRRNKVRQVVSWWKAIQDNVWHLESGQKHQNDPAFYDEKYNVDALTHLFKESVLKECAVQAYFSKHGIVPYTIVYEDMIADFETTIRGLLDYLKLDHSHIKIAAPYYQKTADDFSEQWVQRFRQDFQAGFQDKVY
ncbi:MAG: Stf0 family sulfotransferase [Bacteroidota bacterium]